MTAQFDNYTIDDLRARFHYLMDMANRSKMDKDEALDLIAIAREFESRGYVLNSNQSDWLPITQVRHDHT